MTKQETAGYLCNLITLMESKEDAGIARGRTLAAEYNRVYEEFADLLRKEQEDEARTSVENSDRSQAGADGSRSESRSGVAAGNPRREVGSSVRRTGV